MLPLARLYAYCRSGEPVEAISRNLNGKNKMNVWLKTAVIILLVIGVLWCIVGICAAFQEMNKEQSTERYSAKPEPMLALFLFVGSIALAGMSWAIAAGIYLVSQLATSITLVATRLPAGN